MMCNKCKNDKPQSDFYARKLKNGRVVPRKECKTCRNEQMKQYVASLSPEKHKRRNELMLARQRRYAVEHPFYWLMKQVRFRARRAPVPRIVTIDTTYLETLWNKQKGLCALTGQPMVLSVLDKRGWRNQKDRVSVDRIDADRGYTRQNVQLVRAIVNICKNAYKQGDFIKICVEVTQYQRVYGP